MSTPTIPISIPFAGDTAKLITEMQIKNISAFKLGFGARTICFSEAAKLKKRAVYVCSDIIAAKKAYSQISSLDNNCVYLPPACDDLIYRETHVKENYTPRLSALFNASLNKNASIVTSIEALCQLYPKPDEFKNAIIKVTKGEQFDVGELTKKLIAAGYKKTPLVEAEGEFSLRGDILDIFIVGLSSGVRLEFFGDELESIRKFDPLALVSGEHLDKVIIAPATEIFYDFFNADSILKAFNSQFKKPNDGSEKVENYHRLVSKISSDLAVNSSDMRLKFLMPLLPHASFIDFFDPSLVVFDDAKEASDTIESIYKEHQNRYKLLLTNSECYVGSLNHLTPKEEITAFNAPKTAFHAFDSQNRLFTPDALFNFNSFNFPNYTRNLDVLKQDIDTWRGRGNRVILFSGSKTTKENFDEFFSREIFTGGDGTLEILADTLPESAAFFDSKIIIVGTNNLVGTTSNKPTIKRSKRDAFTEPKVGGFVVHRYHGIGFCEAIKRLKLANAERDYVVLKYDGGDTLYVPVENMDSLSHYDSGENTPKLQKLGGAEFSRIKERVKESISKMALDLSHLYAKREQAKGHAYTMGNEMLDSFCTEFAYTETDDQLTATAECIEDLASGKIMDRLLCGDVGYGKTEVALRAAFKVIQEGKQVAFLSPTTILAKQHFNTVSERMGDFGVRISSLTRFDSEPRIKAALAGLADGRVDIVCGTHRMLSKDVIFNDLGLLILDEEQRFGVADKEKIKALKENINVLTLTATPIPRTLHLSLSGIRDISVLDTPPVERLPVKTYVTEYTQSLISDAVMREVSRGGQVFIVYNRVETMERFFSEVKSILPDSIRIVHAHGRMSGEKLEDKIASFSRGEFDVLIASTIIENGIDMPNANTLIVIDSDRFGLSQLYQLRGRVGRSNRLAYAYFTFDSKKQLTQTAHKRLEAITQFTEFGSGFKIAMRDLEIRGAGNVLGREQHGHIDKIGYDMYCKILAETIQEAKTGQQAQNADDVKIATDFNAFLPDSYVLEHDLRQRVYTRVSQIDDTKKLKELKEELRQIYGVVPVPLENLMLVALVKNLCTKIHASSASLKKNDCSIIFKSTKDIPKSITSFKSAKLDLANGKVSFGTDRDSMLRFLVMPKA